MATLEFSEEDLRVLNAALMQLPYFQVAPLIAKINEQLQVQQAKSNSSPPKPKTR